jgi:hypothetical protein
MKHFYLLIIAVLLTSCTSDQSDGSIQKTDLEQKNLNGKIKKVEQKVYLGEEMNGGEQKTDTLIAELSWDYNNFGFRTNLYHKFYEGGENTTFDSAFPEHREKREYNENGLLIKVVYLSEDGPFSEDQLTYNTDDLLIKKTKHNSEGEITKITKNKYDESSNLVETTDHFPNDRISETETFKYKDGKKVLVEKYDHKNRLSLSTEYKYNDDDYEVQKTLIFANGEQLKNDYRKYDNEDRQLLWKVPEVQIDMYYEYDAKGNLIKQEDTNRDERVLYSYEYDNNDNPIKEIRKSYEGGKLKSIVIIETVITYY